MKKTTVGKNVRLISGLVCFAALSGMAAEFVIPGDPADTDIRYTWPEYTECKVGHFSGETRQVGDFRARGAAVLVFQLPELPAGETVRSSMLSVTVRREHIHEGEGSVDLYALRSSGTLHISVDDYFYGEKNDTRFTKIAENWLSTELENLATQRIALDTDDSATLTQWINHQYASGAKAGDYIFLRASLDTTLKEDRTGGYMIFMSETTDQEPPILTLDTQKAAGTPSSATVVASPRPKQPEPAPSKPAVPQPARGSAHPLTEENLVQNGDFSGLSLAVVPNEGLYSSAGSGRWFRSSTCPWMIAESGGNLGSYAYTRSSKPARLLYVAWNNKSAKKAQLTFDYIKQDPDAFLGVKFFASDRDILIGRSSGQFHMDETSVPEGVIELSTSSIWKTQTFELNLEEGYEYLYILFVGEEKAVGVDNVVLEPVQ